MERRNFDAVRTPSVGFPPRWPRECGSIGQSALTPETLGAVRESAPAAPNAGRRISRRTSDFRATRPSASHKLQATAGWGNGGEITE